MSLVICNMMIIMLFGIVECCWLTAYTLYTVPLRIHVGASFNLFIEQVHLRD